LISPATELREQFDSGEEKDEAPKAPIKGLSLPTIPLDEASDIPAEEPDWLTQLRGTVDEEEDQRVTSDAPPEPADDIPDWLRDLDIEPPTGPAGPEEPEPVEEEMPDWLRASDTPPSAPILEEETTAEFPDWLHGTAPPHQEPEEAEQPDWLQEGMLQSGEQALKFEDDSEDQGPPEPAEIPDWLSALDIEQPSPPTPTDGEPEPEQIEEEIYVPDWLSERDPESEASVYYEDAQQPEEPEEDLYVPDWLGAGEEEEEPPSYEPTPSVEPEEEMEMPDWLSSIEDEPPSHEPTPSSEPEEIPDWLLGLETDAVDISPSASVFPEEAEITPPSEPDDEFIPPVAGEIPDWLREIEAEEPYVPPVSADIPDWLTQPGAEAPSTPVFEVDETKAPIERGDIPDWLMKMKPDGVGPAGGPAAPVEQPPLPDVEELAPAEIPEWLEAMRPSEAGPKEETVETDGVLEGLRGTLPSSPLVDTTGRVEAAPSIAANAATVARAELLQELLSRPTTPELREEKQVRRRETTWTIQHAVIMLLLLAAILAPLIANLVDFQLIVVDIPPLAGNPLAAYNVIQTGIQTGDPVLVAFDYGPAQADEVDKIASPLILHLLDREARLILVSSRPEGLILAERLISGLVRQGLITQEQSDTQIVRLGYLPGRSMGVQSVLSNLTNFSDYWSGAFSQGVGIPADVSSIEDLSLIVVLAGESADLQTWIEQTAMYDGPPMIVGLSARVAPLSLPYTEGAEQLDGAVAGLVEAASYRAARGLDDRQATLQLQSLALAQLVIAGLTVVGAAIFLLRGKKK
jgi:hypothetical protein